MTIYNKLFDWQKKLVNKNLHKSQLGLFLDMGLGKTPISLAFAEQHQSDKLIIITLKSKVTETIDTDGSWQFWNSFNASKPDTLIINYEQLFERKTEQIILKPQVLDFLATCYDSNITVIIDESHKIKNLQSKQTKSIIKITTILKKISTSLYLYLLTGTPFTTGFEDLYSQLKLLGLPMTKTNFIDNFCIRGNVAGLLGWQQPIVAYKNLKQLFKLVHQYAITIKSEDVIDLPKQIFINHKYKQTTAFSLFTKEKANAKDINNFIKRNRLNLPLATQKQMSPFYRNIDYPKFDFFADTPSLFWLRARQLSIGFNGNKNYSIWYDKTRLSLLKAFLSDNKDNYLLFYNYTPELLELYEMCNEIGYNVDVYCGEAKSLYFYEKYSKQNEEQQFNNKSNIILANFSSGSTGINLQNYNKCIIFSIPLFKDYEQGIKRIHRIGQKSTTFYHTFFQDNWLDNSMLSALKSSTNYNEKLFTQNLENNF